MKNIKVSNRYAKALLDIALEKDFVERAREDMETVLQVYNSSREFRLLMNNPVVSSGKKNAVIEELFSKFLSQGTLMYLKILVQKRREMNIGTIANEFLALYKEFKNVKTAVLRTAVPIDDELRMKVIALVKAKFLCEVEIEEVVDPKLIGGFVLKVGDYQFDTSVFSELNRLRKEFQKNVYKPEF